jgi:hypothetical protein
MGMSAAPVKVVIDRLVLRGVDPHHAQALADGLKAELARTLAQPEASTRLLQARNGPVLRLANAPLHAGRAAARTFGTNLARAIWNGMAR